MVRIRGGSSVLCLGIAVFAAACGSSESESELNQNKRVADLSDAELDTLCQEKVEQLSTDPGVIRLFCLVKSSFLDAASCQAAFDFCVRGPVPEAQIVCGHLRAEVVTCQATVGQLSCDDDSGESIDDRLKRTTCDDLHDNWQYLGSDPSSLNSGPCGTPGQCSVWAIDVVGFTGLPRYDAGADEP